MITEGQVKRIIVEMIKNKEMDIQIFGNPNKTQSVGIQFNINEDDYYCDEFIEFDSL